MEVPDLSGYPLCAFFLSGYLSARQDPINFPPPEFPAVLGRYESMFASALGTLGMTKEALKKRPEFNFDSGNAANLEAGAAVLRVVGQLHLWKFLGIALVKPPGADLVCEKNGHKVCVEVKAITKQSKGRADFFLHDQLYEKILESVGKARTQLLQTAAKLQCAVKIFACVVNWFDQSIYLDQDDYQRVVDRLERDGDENEEPLRESLQGVDGVLIVTKMGVSHLFLNESGKCIDA